MLQYNRMRGQRQIRFLFNPQALRTRVSASVIPIVPRATPSDRYGSRKRIESDITPYKGLYSIAD